jgi:excinuclease ABC subunit A
MVDATLALPADTKLMILAPVIVNRKGEHVELFVELRAQGFVRVRVDGAVHEIDAVPKLAKTTKHTIEVVVDRLRVSPEFKQRLAESYETALRHGDGRAIAVETGNENVRAREHLFSSSSRARSATTRSPSLSRGCSVQQPGRRARAATVSMISFFDPGVVASRSSARVGAIKGWDRRNQPYSRCRSRSRSMAV